MTKRSDAPHESMLELAVRLATHAAEISLSRIEEAKVSRKFDNSVVTTTDNEIQAMIVEAIADKFPSHAVCGEETAPTAGACIAPPEARYCWVIDPLDGTRNYVARLPCFATSIGALDRGVPVVGVVYEHNTRQLFTATLGGGAHLNDRQVFVNQLPPESKHLVGIPSTKDDMALKVSAAWHATPGLVCRNFGSTALEMGLVASGSLSGLLGRQVKIWDIAAGTLLISEAGGIITDPLGNSILPFRMDADPQRSVPILAASKSVHGWLLESIRTAMS